MKKNFISLRNFLEDKFPQLVGHIRGENYPLSPPMQALSLVAGLTQTFGFAFIFMGARLFTMLSMPTPEWFEWIQNNKIMTVACVFLFNSLVQSSTATGAFEVSCDGEIIFSKLETGRMPQLQEIMNKLAAAGLGQVDL